MPLSPIDRELLQRCLAKQPGAWNDFVDRYLSLIYHVVHYTAHLRSVRVSPEDVEDVAAEILLRVVADNYRVLRQFQGNASLASYLTVIARRICVGLSRARKRLREMAGPAAPPAKKKVAAPRNGEARRRPAE